MPATATYPVLLNIVFITNKLFATNRLSTYLKCAFPRKIALQWACLFYCTTQKIISHELTGGAHSNTELASRHSQVN